MKNIFLIVASLMFAFVIGASWLSADGAASESRGDRSLPVRINLSWTADTNGNVSVETERVRGKLVRAVMFHGTNNAPTGSTYNVSVSDASGIDVLAGQASAVPTNSPGEAVQYLPGVFVVNSEDITNLYHGVHVNERLTLSVSGVGSNAQGTVVIYSDAIERH